jgi:hypothetical protein
MWLGRERWSIRGLWRTSTYGLGGTVGALYAFGGESLDTSRGVFNLGPLLVGCSSPDF